MKYETYISKELISAIDKKYNTSTEKTNRAITGLSMGGHGALVLGMRNPQQYRSISAFSPVSHPSRCPWGIKVFSHYLGENKDAWKAYDACEILKNEHCRLPILVDQGDKDGFLEEQLCTQELVGAAKTHDSNLTLRMQEGYDHSYFFISSFIAEHLEFHSNFLIPKDDRTT